MKILKFGGGVLKDDISIKMIPNILLNYKSSPIIIVVSAFDKTTNLLEGYLESNYQNKKYRKKYSIFSSRAFRELMFIAWKLNLINYKDGSFFYLIKELINNTKPLFKDFDFDYDQIVSLGELISSKIVSCFLLNQGINNHWVDIRKYLITDSNYRDANINWSLTKQNFQNKFPKQNIIITQGFIGSNKNVTTTLGREGSDYSASIIGNLLNASEVILFKDVEGVYEKDPKAHRGETIHLIPRLSYDDIQKYSNPKRPLVHKKTIRPLKEKSIMLKIKKFSNTDVSGTIIS